MRREAIRTGAAEDEGSRARRRANPRRRGRARLLPFAAALAFGLAALVPQFQLWYDRGRDWRGHAASVHPDEAAYRAYVNALAQGRTRRNDPYTGRDAEMTAADVETMFSIQCLPAYALALPGRLFGVATDTTFIALAFLAAFLAVLAVERLIAAAAADAPGAAWLSTAGALFVLSFAALARAQKPVYWLTGRQTFFIPLLFLRRYLPAAAFPLLFVFCLLVWRALAREDRRGALAYAAGAGAIFALLVYSYFYLWTAALAWLACLALPWLLLARGDRRRGAEVFAAVGAFALAALAPYALLLARRPAWMDSDQLLAHTRAPDLLRPPELIGFACVALLAFAARRGVVESRDRRVIFAASFALTPAAVFNQQIVTGLSLQPIHYELFVANYLALVSAVLTAALLWQARRQSINRTPPAGEAGAGGQTGTAGDSPPPGVGRRPYPRRALAAVAILSLCWSVFEISLVARRYRAVNLELDERHAAALKLAELARGGGANARGTVFSTDTALSGWQTGVAPQPVLWAAHMHSFGAVPPAEDRERLFTQLHLAGVDAEEFAGPVLRRYRGSIFGWGRAFYGLTADYRPVTPEEERAAAESFARFAENFGRAEAARFPVAYAVVSDERATRLANLDRWYERVEAGRVGRYSFYRVTPKP
jgi:hypothetical protein